MNREEYDEALYLAHHGVKGQRWGVRRFQNEDGTLTPKGQKRYDKIKNTNSARYLYKHRKDISEEDYNKAYERVNRDYTLKNIASKEHATLRAVGKKAASVALKAGLAVGTYAFLTKTDAGKKLVQTGKDKVKDIIKSAVSEAASNTKEAAVNAAKEVRANVATNASQAVKSGNRPVKALYEYGKMVDKIVKKRR